eukprot:6214198-Pleurochrysis_carterae.AAC.2
MKLFHFNHVIRPQKLEHEPEKRAHRIDRLSHQLRYHRIEGLVEFCECVTFLHAKERCLMKCVDSHQVRNAVNDSAVFVVAASVIEQNVKSTSKSPLVGKVKQGKVHSSARQICSSSKSLARNIC